jgi:hypothetical protein
MSTENDPKIVAWQRRMLAKAMAERRRNILIKHARESDGDLTDAQFEAAAAAGCNQGPHPLDLDAFENQEHFRTCMGNKWWRVNNLYFVINPHGKRVQFRMNAGQIRLFNNLWPMNLVLKSRQWGFTTAIDIWFLDDVLFTPDLEGAIIAHNLDSAQKIFRRKIKYTYDNLPEAIRAVRTLKTDSKTELAFKENNSVLSVATSFRSGTAQRLHISEFGKICAQFPHKAREIVTGALEAVHEGQIVIIESTAEGKHGYFYEYCREAEDILKSGRQLSPMEWRLHFFGWMDDPKNRTATPIPIKKRERKYFAELEAEIGQRLTAPQRHWYAIKWRRLGDDMKREYPATPKEAFDAAVKGAYFAHEFADIRQEKRICKVPVDPALMVHTAWDLGMDDCMAIWFFQTVGREIRLVNYYENSGYGFRHYAKEMAELGYNYGRHFGPHDLNVRMLTADTQGKTRVQAAREVGISFERVPRVKDKLDSIEAARNLLPLCLFDEENTAEGYEHLEMYRKEFDDDKQAYKTHPLHDVHSNGADAFQTLAMAPIFGKGGFLPGGDYMKNRRPPPTGGWT